MLQHRDYHYHHHHQQQQQLVSARDAKNELEHMLQATTQYIVKQDDILSEMETVERTIRKDVNTAKAEVKKAAQQTRDIISKREAVLMRHIETCEAAAIRNVRFVQREVSRCKESALTFKNDVDTLQQSGEDIDQDFRSRTLKEFYKQMSARQLGLTWQFVPEYQQLSAEHLRMILGNVWMRTPTVVTPGQMVLGKPLRTMPLVPGGKYMVSGMAVLGDCLCITHFCQSQLWLHDMSDGSSKACDIPGDPFPTGLAVVRSTERVLVIVDRGSRLHYVTISPELDIADHRVKDIPLKNPRKVSVCPETGQLLIGQMDAMDFAVCSPEGDLQRRVSVCNPDGSGRHVLCVLKGKDQPYAAMVWDADWKASIMWVDEAGNWSRTHRFSDAFWPRYMIQDRSRGLLIMADWNNSVHLLDTRRRFTHQCLLTAADGVMSPSCLLLDETRGHLYLAHHPQEAQEVRVYMWPTTRMSDTQTTNFQLGTKLPQFD